MDKHVIAGRALDKSIALGGVEPLHNTFFSHLHFSPDFPEDAPQGPKKEKASELNPGLTRLDSRCSVLPAFQTTITVSHTGDGNFKHIWVLRVLQPWRLRGWLPATLRFFTNG